MAAFRVPVEILSYANLLPVDVLQDDRDGNVIIKKKRGVKRCREEKQLLKILNKTPLIFPAC